QPVAVLAHVWAATGGGGATGLAVCGTAAALAAVAGARQSLAGGPGASLHGGAGRRPSLWVAVLRQAAVVAAPPLLRPRPHVSGQLSAAG
nr:hypothetical protein [Tanacetum cinerariifolium]